MLCLTGILTEENTMAPLLNIKQAAEVLGLSGHTLRGHVAAGRIAHRRIGGAIRFCESDLEEFVEQAKRPAKEMGSDQPARKKPAKYQCQIFGRSPRPSKGRHVDA